MSLMIDLPQPVASRLQAEAAKSGVSTAEYAAELLTKSLPTSTIDPEEQKQRNAPSIALLETWLQRTLAPATPEQIAEAEAELEAFMRNMNAPRKEAGERLLYPDVETSKTGSQV